jgi:preprotein translocase subunit SecB
MKRNLLLAIAVAAIMIASTVAQAADITFSGQIRPRFQIDEDHNDQTSPLENFETRVRLNAKANVNANTEVFLQFQSVGVWGQNTDADGTRVSVGGGGD